MFSRYCLCHELIRIEALESNAQKKSTKFSESPKKVNKIQWKPKKGQRNQQLIWIIETWLDSIPYSIFFEPWVDLNQNSGKFFESWVDLNQNILEAFQIVSRFGSNFRNPFWVMSWFQSILVKPCESLVESNRNFLSLSWIDKKWVVPMSDFRLSAGLSVESWTCSQSRTRPATRTDFNRPRPLPPANTEDHVKSAEVPRTRLSNRDAQLATNGATEEGSGRGREVRERLSIRKNGQRQPPVLFKLWYWFFYQGVRIGAPMHSILRAIEEERTIYTPSVHTYQFSHN